jgi:hypothetical protein
LKDLADLELISIKKEKSIKQNVTDFQQILLNGPTWNEEEYQEYLKNREAINLIGRI